MPDPANVKLSSLYNPPGLILTKAIYEVEELIIYDIIVSEPKGFVNFQDNVYQLKKIAKE